MRTRAWMDQSTALFLSTVQRLTDAELDAASALPGWTRRHVIGHVAANAEALRRLLSWAATGVETRMYSGPDQRAQEIEEAALLPADDLRAFANRSARALAADMDALPEAAWRNLVITAQGRTVPAEEIPWMRTREVAVHAVDLGHGVGFADLPDDLNSALATDATAKHAGKGHAAELAAWLTGRSVQSPALGPWL